MPTRGQSPRTQAPAPSNGHTSPIEAIRNRRPPAGERGQIRTAWYPFWRQQVGPVNPSKLRFTDYEKMERDPQVRAGLMIRELAILGKPPVFNYDPINPRDPEEQARGKQMVDFLTHVWQHLSPGPTRILRELLTYRRYGFSVFEKVWRSRINPENKEPEHAPLENGPWAGYLVLSKLKLLPHETLEDNGIVTDPFGNLTGIWQRITPAQRDLVPNIPVSRDESGRYRILFTGPDLDRVFLLAASPRPNNSYGLSDLEPAYNYWYSKQSKHAWLNILLERTSGVVVGEYEDPTQQDSLETALNNIGPEGVLTVPKGSSVSILRGWENAVTGYLDAIRFDDIQILRALLVPIETVGGDGSDVGSFAKANSHFESFMLAVRQIQLEVEEAIEQEFVRPLILANFGDVPRFPTFDFPELREKDRSTLAQIWSSAIRDGYVDPSIDASWLRQEMGVPADAPAGHVFSRPQTQAPQVPGGMGVVPFAAQRAMAPGPLGVFEERETGQHRRLLVDGFTSSVEARVTEAALRERDRLLQNPPRTLEDLTSLTIDKAWLRDALNDTAVSVLHRVLTDAAGRFRDLQRPNEEATLRRLADALPKARLSAAPGDPEPLPDPTLGEALLALLRAYLEWSSRLNEFRSEGTAAELAARLRERLLQGILTGEDETRLGRLVEDEFASYTRSQIDTVANTTVMDYYNSARNTAFDAAGDYVRGVKLVPLLDSTTTPFCRHLVGRSISRSDPLYDKLRHPPFWYNCRTTVVPVLATDTTHEFNTDWPEWLREHAADEGGGFLLA